MGSSDRTGERRLRNACSSDPIIKTVRVSTRGNLGRRGRALTWAGQKPKHAQLPLLLRVARIRFGNASGRLWRSEWMRLGGRGSKLSTAFPRSRRATANSRLGKVARWRSKVGRPDFADLAGGVLLSIFAAY
jgi:hypothetical protein